MAYTAQPTSDFDPSLPDDDDHTLSLDEIIRAALASFGLGLRVAMPAKVVAVLGEQKVDIQPLLQTRYKDAAAAADYPVIRSVPVAMPVGAAWHIKYPIAAGDTGLALFADRSLDAWTASDGSAPVDPGDVRQHHLTDAVFLPGLPAFARNTQDGTTDLVVRNGDAQVRVLANGKIQLKNASQEALSLLDGLAQTLQGAKAMTAFGPAPLDPATLQALVQFVTNLATLKA